jgi:tetratricopeptide (TPR) repeat protein
MTVCCLLWVGAQAQSDPFAEISSELAKGAYALAAQVEGPKLIQAYPNRAEARYFYSYALYLTEDYKDARAQLQKALELAKAEKAGDPRYVWLEGLLDAATGNLKGAEALLRQAAMQSHDYAITMDWGRVAWERGDFKDALQAFQAAADTAAGKTQPWPYLNRGRLLIFEQDYSAAITALNAAINVADANDTQEGLPSPAYVEAYYRLGEVYEALHQPDKAASNYQAARTADPNYAPALRALDRLREGSP